MRPLEARLKQRKTLAVEAEWEASLPTAATPSARSPTASPQTPHNSASPRKSHDGTASVKAVSCQSTAALVSKGGGLQVGAGHGSDVAIGADDE